MAGATGKGMRRLLGVGGAVILTFSLVAAAGAQAADGPDVIASDAEGAVVSLVTRSPAETRGGALFTRSRIASDTTAALAAGLTGGDLAESSLEGASDDYRNGSLVRAQWPPSHRVPAEDHYQGGQQAPDGAPVAGRVTTIVARASQEPRALAEAVGGGLGNAELSIGGGAASSRSELRRDGALVTRSQVTALNVVIGGILRIAELRAVAEAVIPQAGSTTSALRLTVTGAKIGEASVEITPDGIRLNGGRGQAKEHIAQFNAGLAALAARGIAVVAVPSERQATPGAALARGAALAIRYSLAPQAGGDEEIRLAAVSADAKLQR